MKKIKCFIFLLVGLVFFLVIQEILDQDFQNDMESGVMMGEFYEITEESNIQVAIIGASGMGYDINPMKMYKDTGIVAFNFATGGQPAQASYCLCKEIFKTQHPEVVIMDASSIFSDTFWAGGYRYILDTLPFDNVKLELAYYYADLYDANNKGNQRMKAFMSAIMPFYQYHTRWSALTKDDFILKNEKNEYRKGYFLCNTTIGSHISIAQMNSFAEQEYWSVNMTEGTQQTLIEDGIYNPHVNEVNWQYILKMKDFCEKNGAEFLLVKTPAFGHPLSFDTAWTLKKSRILKERVMQMGIEFIDFQYDVDLRFDWTIDAGAGTQHLNYLGASKVTEYLEGVLQDRYGLTRNTCVVYEEDIPVYDRMCQFAELTLTKDIFQYFNQFSKWEDATIFFSVSDDMTTGISDEICQLLNEIGLQTDFHNLSYSDSYIAVVEKGNVKYEAYSNHALTYNNVLENGVHYSITSSGYFEGASSKIIIEGTDYSTNGRGLNMVILDNKSGMAIDSVRFDLYSADWATIAVHNNSLREDAREKYEQYLMANGI